MHDSTATWKTACEELRKTMGEVMFTRWIEPLVCTATGEHAFMLRVNDDFTQLYITNNFLSLIREEVAKIDPAATFTFSIDPSLAPFTPEPEMPAPLPLSSSERGELRGMPLDPNFTFENFVVGPSNSFAAAAAQQAAKNPGGASNPILFYGATGLGKTHLMQAVAHAVHERDPRATIVYITLEAMLNDFIECIRTNRSGDFHRRYRQTDMLLVDDVQFLAKSAALQEEFFNIFNTLHNAHKQIILTSDQPPNAIQGLSDRLVSRFQQGLVTDLQTPDYATRMAILRSKQSDAENPLPDEFLAYIAENITSNVRRLEGALTKLVCYRNLLGKALSQEIVTEQLRSFVADEQKADPTCADIQRVVVEEYDLRLADMTSSARPQNVATPRMVAMFLCRKLTHNTLEAIAQAFDKKHATIVHAWKTIPGRIETDRDLRRHVESIVSKLGRSFDDLL